MLLLMSGIYSNFIRNNFFYLKNIYLILIPIISIKFVKNRFFISNK